MSRIVSGFFFLMSLLTVLWVGTGLLNPSFSQTQRGAPTTLIPNIQVESETAATPATPDLSITEFGAQEAEGFTYDPTGRRDPFRPYGLEVESAQPPGGAVLPGPIGKQEALTDLQTFDLNSFKIIAISWGLKPNAILRDPTGKYHTVKKYTKLGKANGFVAVIREGEIVVVEPAVVDGMPTAVTKSLLLGK